jgi:uncharacterized protein YacL
LQKEDNYIVETLNSCFVDLNLQENSDIQQIDYSNIIATKIDYLIANDFNGLLFILYRLDVDEAKVKEMIAQSGGLTPGLTIANLVLKRLEEKVFWRKKFKSQSDEIIDDEERW